MPFFDLDALQAEYVTPKYSKAFGPLVSGEQIEVGRLRFGAGEGAVPHSHPQEQIMVVLRGRLRVTLGDETRELGLTPTPARWGLGWPAGWGCNWPGPRTAWWSWPVTVDS